jgi:hypothetical protein
MFPIPFIGRLPSWFAKFKDKPYKVGPSSLVRASAFAFSRMAAYREIGTAVPSAGPSSRLSIMSGLCDKRRNANRNYSPTSGVADDDPMVMCTIVRPMKDANSEQRRSSSLSI